MTFDILANLDQEARWSGHTLPSSVLERISAASALLAALAPDDADVHVWALAEVNSGRLCELPNWKPPHMHTGDRGAYNLTWGNPLARAVNDRRFALDVARELGCALHGARPINSLDELDRHIALRTDVTSWVCKAVWTTAGRDRVYGKGTSYLREPVERLLERGPVVFEPWLERICDVAVCGSVGDRVVVEAPHGLISSARGGFRGIRIGDTGLEIAEHDVVLMRAERVGLELQRAGYRGPYGVDAFVYRHGDKRRLHPLCEINARFTFGHVAHALDRRLGIASLELGTTAPADAAMLIRPTHSDPSCAWVTSRA